MNTRFIILYLFIGLLFIGSCKQKMICSAYQSYFILDKEVAEEMYSPFGSDSMPREMETNTDGNGIAQKVDDKVFEKKQYIVKMKLIPPKKLDSTALDSNGVLIDKTQEEDIENIDDIDIEDTEQKEEEEDISEDDIDLDDDSIWDDDEEEEEEEP